MKLKFLQAAVAGLMLSACSFANATLITHNGYTLDTDTKIVSNGVIEWLQWTETKNESINSSLATFSSDGWTLSSNAQMFGLFADFGFSTTGSLESVSVIEYGSYIGGSDTDSYDLFLALFGANEIADGIASYGTGDDGRLGVHAYFGDDENNNGFFQRASVLSDNLFNGTEENAPFSQLSAEDFFNTANDREFYTSVALVRNVSSTSVPEPSTLAIFALGIMGLSARRFKKK